MKVFISWSGDRSRKFAEFLYALLRKYNFGLDPWLSGPAISYGTRWRNELAKALAGTQIGILCLTRDTQASPWVAFEAGALSKEPDVSRVIPVLLDFDGFDPHAKYLEQFQYVVASVDTVTHMIKDLSAASGTESRMDPDMIAGVWMEKREELEELLEAIARVPPSTGRPAGEVNEVAARRFDVLKEYLESIDERLSHLETGRTPDGPAQATDELRELLPQIIDRPALRVVDDKLASEVPESWAFLEESLGSLEAVLPAVGRLNLDNHPTFGWVGTAFLVSADVAITTDYTVNLFAKYDGERWRFRHGVAGEELAASIDFGPGGSFRIREIVDVVEVSGGSSIALLRLASAPAAALAVLSSRPPDTLAGLPVGVIGYPAWDSRVPQPVLKAVFGDQFEGKHVMLGRLYKRRDGRVVHDCITAGGTGGAPVVDVQSGSVVGVHYASEWKRGAKEGRFLKSRRILDSERFHRWVDAQRVSHG
jgi:hypothetical protein